MTPKFEKNFPLVRRACQEESIDKNTLHFDLYSHLAIRLNIFLLSVATFFFKLEKK